MNDPAAMVATLDLRPCCRSRVLRDVVDPSMVRALLARQAGFEVRDAPRLLLVDDARSAPAHRAGLAALAADRSPTSVLLVLVGPTAPTDITHQADTAPPAEVVAAVDTGVCGEPLDIALDGDSLHDLDAAYDPALYTFLEHHSDEPGLPASSTSSETATGAPPSPAASGAPGAVIPAILWVGDHEGRPRPTQAAVGAATPPGAGGCDADRHDPPALRALLDALRGPEVFDRVCHEVAAMPGRLAFPGVNVIVGRVPDETLRTLRIHAARRFVSATERHGPTESVPVDGVRLRREVEAALAGGLPLADVHGRLARTVRPARADRLSGLAHRLPHPVRRPIRRVARRLRRGRAPVGLLAGHTAELLDEVRAYADTLAGDRPFPSAGEQPGVSHAVSAALAEHEDELSALLNADLADLAITALLPVWAGLAGTGPTPTVTALGRLANDLLDSYGDHLRDAGVLAAPAFGSSADARADLARRVWQAAARRPGDDDGDDDGDGDGDGDGDQATTARGVGERGRSDAIPGTSGTGSLGTTIHQLASAGQAGLLDPRPEAARLILFAPDAARPPREAGGSPRRADPRTPPLAQTPPVPQAPPAPEAVVWTASTLVAGVLRLTPARTADVLDVLFPGSPT